MLEVNNVCVSFRSERQEKIFGTARNQVLFDVSLKVSQGTCLGILGESGSGKSTLGRVICGLLKPDTGEVKIQDVSVYASRNGRKNLQKRLSVVFQDYTTSANPRFRVKEIIAEGLAPDKENMKRFRQKKKVLDDVFQSMEQAVSNQEKRLGQTELLFNTGGGFVADAQDEARRWMEEYNNNHPHEVIRIFHKYQKIIAGFFKDHEKNQKNRTGNDLLEICNQIVAGSLESREEYMKVRLTNLVQGDATQFFKKLEENWKFPVRLIGGFQTSSHQTLFVMGNEENLLCRCLRDQPTYDISFKGCPQDDRIEIVRISGRFAENRIYSE